jgi:hypothetical protein
VSQGRACDGSAIGLVGRFQRSPRRADYGAVVEPDGELAEPDGAVDPDDPVPFVPLLPFGDVPEGVVPELPAGAFESLGVPEAGEPVPFGPIPVPGVPVPGAVVESVALPGAGVELLPGGVLGPLKPELPDPVPAPPAWATMRQPENEWSVARACAPTSTAAPRVVPAAGP